MLSFLFLRYLSDNYETAAQKELGKDYAICEKEIVAANDETRNEIIAELKRRVIDYFESLPVEKLPVKENETDKTAIQQARQARIDDYEVLLESGKLTPLGVWYIRNLDQITEFEKQMRRKVHFVIQPYYLWSTI